MKESLFSMTNGFQHSLKREQGLNLKVRLNNGIEMPWLGYGVYDISNRETAEWVSRAIESGYRLIDTASLYGNEEGVGEGVLGSGIDRSKVFVTTKVWIDEIRKGEVQKSLENSLRRLKFDYIDLFLLHWPVDQRNPDAWGSMNKLLESGKARSIGVSNFMPEHLEEIKEVSGIVPALNQIEFQPKLLSDRIRAYCDREGIQLQAWSPLMRGKLSEDAVLNSIAQKHGKSVSQVILRWELQMGVSVIPKTTTASRLIENSDVFDFNLDTDEVTEIAKLDSNERLGADPYLFGYGQYTTIEDLFADT